MQTHCANVHSVPTGIGNTPLYKLKSLRAEYPGIDILIKAEWLNPGGSVKDRAASNIIRDAEASGALTRNQVLIDSSSGNYATSLAMIGAARGYQVMVCVPSSIPRERRCILEALGAALRFTESSKGSDGALEVAREIAASDSAKYFYTNQYSNPANWQAHYNGTAGEILSQTGGEITHLVICVGSSGTFTGIARRLKEISSSIRCIAVQPDRGCHRLRGMKHMATSIQPGIYDPSLADETIFVNSDDALAATRTLALEEGLLVGPTSGAAFLACCEVARCCQGPARIVTIFADSALNYLSELS
jgi:cysteine synthase B